LALEEGAAMSARKDEKECVHFRSERFECANGKWFVEIREEQKPIGPFASKELAVKAAEAYTKDILAGRSPVSSMSDQFLFKAFSVKQH
tara:strand:- start:69579 stop:69845 length:267 start_codon:yes stop_codon:yes gene_type:complete